MDVLQPTLKVLAETGRNGYEAFVAWGGTREEDSTFIFRAAYKPRQKSYKTEDGLHVVVEEEALDRLNRDFNEQGLILAGQVHAHPGSAYHSDTDDLLPIVTILGGLSLVVPDFAAGGVEDRSRFSWFRLRAYGEWIPIGDETVIEVA